MILVSRRSAGRSKSARSRSAETVAGITEGECTAGGVMEIFRLLGHVCFWCSGSPVILFFIPFYEPPPVHPWSTLRGSDLEWYIPCYRIIAWLLRAKRTPKNRCGCFSTVKDTAIGRDVSGFTLSSLFVVACSSVLHASSFCSEIWSDVSSLMLAAAVLTQSCSYPTLQLVKTRFTKTSILLLFTSALSLTTSPNTDYWSHLTTGNELQWALPVSDCW